MQARARQRGNVPARVSREPRVRISRQNLLVGGALSTRVGFGGESMGALLSREKVCAAMHMLQPGESVTLHDEACRWTLSCAAANVVGVRCTRAAGFGPSGAAGAPAAAGFGAARAAPALLGLSATLTGAGMAVRCAELHPETQSALAYMNDQLFPRREACVAALAALRTGAVGDSLQGGAPEGPSGGTLRARARDAARDAARNAARDTPPDAAGWRTQARTGIPKLFGVNNGGVVSMVAESMVAKSKDTPKTCRVQDVARELYLAGLMCATAPKTDTPMLVVGSAGRAVPLGASLAGALYREPPLKQHLSVVVLGADGPERVNCNLRAVRAGSENARQLAEVLGPLGAEMRGDCFVLSGPMSNNFALVLRQDAERHGDRARERSSRGSGARRSDAAAAAAASAAAAEAVSRGLALAHA